MPDAGKFNVIWEPTKGPQTALLTCPVFEVLYGGARGGGKTDGVLGEWASHADLYGEGAIGLMVRRSRTELVETIERSKQLFRPLGCEYQTQEHMWRMVGGARLRFAYLENDADADQYQGHSYTRVYPEEIGNFPNPAPIMKLMATLRSGSGVPVGLRATGNPGGPGHHWVKARYIDAAPMGWKVQTETFVNPFTNDEIVRDRVYIPSRVTDNPYLGGDYIANLHMSGSPELVRAWLQGDWSVIAGAFFPEFGPAHVVKAHALPATWTRFRAMDWGSARPFSVGWYAVSDGSLPIYPRGALIKYREWYGASAPNVGLKLTAEAVGQGIAERERGETITDGVLDPAAFSEDGGPSIAERMRYAPGGGPVFRRADNSRVAQRGALGGWDMLRHRLIGEGGRPMLYFFDTCVDTIRTIPAAQHDKRRPEDMDSDGEDHALDETRYACLSRPWVRDPKVEDKPKFAFIAGPDGVRSGPTFAEIVARRTARRMGEAA